MSGETEKDKIWALRRLAKDWSSYDLITCTYVSAANGTTIGGEGILVTDGHPSNPTVHHSYAIPAGTWCSSFQAEMKAMKKALLIIETDESPKEVRIVSDRQPVLLRLASIQPAIPLMSAVECDNLGLLAALHDDGHQMTFTWVQATAG